MADDDLLSDKKRSYFSKPENLVTWGVLGGLGFLAFKGLDYILPLVNRVFENLLYTAVLTGALGVVGFLFVNKDFHRLAWYGYKVAMRWLTEWFVTLDPIAILEAYIDSLRTNLEQIKASLGALRQQRIKLEQIIANKGSAYGSSMNKMGAAKARLNPKDPKASPDQSGNRTMERQIALQARRAGRLEKSTLTYQGLLAKLNTHIAIMEKVGEAAEFMVEDITDTVAEEKEKRQTIKESYKAMAGAKKILQAGKQRELYDMAMENVTNDYQQKLGEIEQFMKDTESFVVGMDLENGEFEAQAMERLAAWETKSTVLLSGGTGKTKFRVEPAQLGAGDVVEGDELQPADAPLKQQSYADLFEQLKK
jgi:hypothetical protein